MKVYVFDFREAARGKPQVFKVVRQEWLSEAGAAECCYQGFESLFFFFFLNGVVFRNHSICCLCCMCRTESLREYLVLKSQLKLFCARHLEFHVFHFL